MASRDVCSMCGGRIGLSEESMQNDVTLRLAHARCVHASNAPINPVPREVKLPPPPLAREERLAQQVQLMRDALFEIAEGVGNGGETLEAAGDRALEALSACDELQDELPAPAAYVVPLNPPAGLEMPVEFSRALFPESRARDFIDAKNRSIISKLMELKNRYRSDAVNTRGAYVRLQNALLQTTIMEHTDSKHVGPLDVCQERSCAHARAWLKQKVETDI